MDATVLPLTWPSDFDLSDLRRFETEARKLRYQALGKACSQKGITALMVAHHADDQAETVLMRLSSHRVRSGLQAMQSVEWIPECTGMYGVYHSGADRRLGSSSNHRLPEQGGIQVLRPLLSFPKARLVATCEERKIPWAEDQTNQDPTLTARNAVRHIYKHHKLPEALSVESLVNLSLCMQRRVEAHKAYAERLFDQCLLQLTTQTGYLLVRFPPFAALLDRPIASYSDRDQARNNAYHLIKRVADLVSPRSIAPLGKLAAAVDKIYPEFVAIKSAAGLSAARKNFCVYGVWWRVCDKPSPFVGRCEVGVDAILPHPREWHLHRQPFDDRERTPAAHVTEYPPLSGFTSASKHSYVFFDGRFWVNVRNLSFSTLVLRRFSHDDNSRLNSSPSNRFITAALRLLKPWDLRFVLPAVFCKDEATGEETLVGFPTLDVRIEDGQSPLGNPVCKWSVRYKKVEFGRHRPDAILAAGISKQEIDDEEERHWRVGQRSSKSKGERKKKACEVEAMGMRQAEEQKDGTNMDPVLGSEKPTLPPMKPPVADAESMTPDVETADWYDLFGNGR